LEAFLCSFQLVWWSFFVFVAFLLCENDSQLHIGFRVQRQESMYSAHAS
jgi:hypothetical protein